MAQISLDETQELTPQVNLDLGVSAPPQLEETELKNRAFKFDRGLSNVIDTSSAYERLKNSEEKYLRFQAVTAKDLQNSAVRNQAIINAAARKGGPLEQGDIDALGWEPNRGIKPWPTNPGTIMEENYADWYIKSVSRNQERNDFGKPWTTQVGADPILGIYRDKALGATKELVAQDEYVNTAYEDAAAEYKNQSGISFAGDLAKDIFSAGLYTEYKLRGNVPGSSMWKGFIGTNLQDQADRLRAMPLEQLKDELPPILARLTPGLKLSFMTYLKGISSTEARFDDVMSAINLGGLALGLGKVGIKALRASKDAKEIDAALKKLVTENAKPGEITEARVAEAVGDIDTAAEKQVAEDLVRKVEGKGDPLQETVDAMLDPFKTDTTKWTARLGSMAKEAANRLTEDSNVVLGKMVDTLTRTLKVDRIQGLLATEANMKIIRDEAISNYRGAGGLMQITGPEHNPITNTWSWKYHLGDNKAVLFKSEDQAKIFAETMSFQKYGIEQDGMGWKITFDRPLVEDGYLLKDGIILTKDQSTPHSYAELFSSWLGYGRTPEETLAREQTWNRKIAAYAPSNFLKLAKEMAEPIRRLARGDIVIDPLTGKEYPRFTYTGGSGSTRSRFKEWKQTVEYAKTQKDELGRPGVFFDTIADLEDHYLRTFQRVPTFEEVDAYIAFKRLTELDRTFRNIQLYKLKSRLGVEQHQFSGLQDLRANNMPAGQSRVMTGWFDGILRKDFPTGSNLDNILVMGDKLGSERVMNLRTMPSATRTELKKAVAKGEGQIIELHDPSRKPLMGFGNVDEDHVSYVYVKNGTLQTKPLDFEQIPRRGGGHFDYDYEHYVKQANMQKDKHSGNWWYHGDNTVMPINSRAMGADIAKKLDDVRLLLQQEKMDEAKALAQKTLPMDWKEINSWFRPQYSPDGKKLPPRLNLTEKIQVVPKNTKIAGINSELINREGFVDGTSRGSPAARYPVPYTQERDNYEVFTLADKGSKGNPLYQSEPAKFVDPITSMNRGLSRIINTTFSDDYKISAVEHWLKEYASAAKIPIEDLASSPYWNFQNPQYLGNIPQTQRNILEANRMKIQQFIGVPNKWETFLHTAAQDMADSIYKKFGPTRIEPAWLLHKMTDAPAFVRSLAFHAGLGFFSVPQLLVQANNFVSILGIAGARYAGPAAYGAVLHGATAFNKNPEILQYLDQLATKMRIPGMSRYKPGEWLEAHQEYTRTGMRHVGGEYSMVDNPMNTKILTSMFESFMDAGTMFFKGGEKGSRATAYYSAFKEFRDKNPVGRLTDRDRAAILNRADTLNGNMTRASNSALNHGVLSIPTQFYTYVLRQAELFTGKRLTPVERARLFGTHFALYGAPLAAGLTGLPIGDMFQKAAIENGYAVGTNWINDLTMNGLPSLLAGLITGNQYNIGDRYGVQGYQPLVDVFKSDETILKFIGGAAGQKISNSFTALDPFFQWAQDYMTGKGEYKLQAEDFAKPFLQISSANALRRYSAAVNTGRWITSNGMSTTQPGQISQLNALFMTLTGLQPIEAGQVYEKGQIRNAELENQKRGLKEFVAEFRQGIYNVNNKNPEEARVYFKNALIKLIQSGYPQEKIHQALAIASRGFEDTISKVDFNFYNKDVPEKYKAARKEAYKAMLQMRK